MQTCTDGGFENGASSLSYYTFRQAIFPTWPPLNPNVVNEDMLTTDFNFVPYTASTNIFGNQNSYATLVGSGNDPNVPVNRVLTDNRAIRLNNSSSTGGFVHITTMSRTFTVNENYFNFNYSLILENPEHPSVNQPFFVIRIYDQNNNIVRQINAVSNLTDCMYTILDPPGDDNIILYTGWVCDRINVSQFMGQTVTAEFIIADCDQGGHWGKVYIDDLCGTNCAAPLNGGINLNSIPNIDCPTQDITICGTYTLPNQAEYDNISLDIVQNGTAIGTISSPSTLNPNGNGGTFCFDVPLSLFGANPNGDYEFEVQGNFIRDCGGIQDDFPLDPIFDFSANDSGPDVSFNDCITAADDSQIFSQCTSTINFSLLDNDFVYDDPANPANTILTIVGPLPPGINVNTSTGFVSASSLATGTYTFQYQICNTNNPSHCDLGTVSIEITPPEIIANDNNFTFFPINGCEGGGTTSVLNNDTYCDQPLNPQSLNEYTVTLLDDDGSGAVVYSTGIIEVPPTAPGTYILTYQVCNSSNSCDTAQATIIVNYGIVPEFSFLTDICKDTPAPNLPLVSDNGVTGTWNPSTIDNQTSGTYTFTPSENCAETIVQTVTIIEECGLFLDWGSEVGCQEAGGIRKFDFWNIEGTDCLRVCENASITYTITGAVDAIDYVEWNVTGGAPTISQDGTSCEIQWGTGSFSFIDIKVVLLDGTILHMNKCVEKMDPPTALFGIMPDPHSQEELVACAKSPVIFENLSSVNDGEDDLYYNWDFGDGTTSNEFEPTHIYGNPGNYIVKLNVFNGCSCRDEYALKIKVTEPFPPIECVGVVCEDAVATYYIKEEECPIKWETLGGDIIWESQDHTSVSVQWNDVDEAGFGYITASSEGCVSCSTTAKIPVVQVDGTIQGREKLCSNSQGLYSLPKWPTTDFNWTLVSNGTGASLVGTDQRNEIVVQAGSSGTITLNCSYFNTLLGCSGSATFTIEIKPTISLGSPDEICESIPETFGFNDENGSPINTVDWMITGPDNYSLTGSSSPFTITFPEAGTYVVEVLSDMYCGGFMHIQVEESPETPVSISGPLLVCPGVPNIYSTDVPAGSTAHWEITNGEIIGPSTGGEVQVDFFAGYIPFEVSVWFENGTDCPSQPYTLTVEPDIPDLNFTEGDAEACGSSFSTYAVAATDAETYYWQIVPSSAGSIANGQNTNEVMVLWNQVSLQNVQVKVTARKCAVYFNNSFLVNIIDSPEITIIGPSPATACVGHEVDFAFDPPPNGFVNVIWDFGDGYPQDPLTNNVTSYTYTLPLANTTTYTVTATVYTGCSLPSVDTFTITVSPSPVVTISPNHVNACSSTNTTFYINQQGGFAGTDQIQWYKDGNAVGTDSPSFDAAGQPGDYYAVVTNSYGCTDTTITVEANDCDNDGDGDGDEGGPPNGDPACDGAPSLDATYTSTVDCDGITIDINSISGATVDTFFSDWPYGANVDNNGPLQLQISGLEPGHYDTKFKMIQDYNGALCPSSEDIDFFIPYVAGLKYNISCAGNGLYNVEVLNFSVYYPETPPNLFSFNANNGTWHTGAPNADGIQSWTTQLAPGTHEVGIKIAYNGSNGIFAPCEAFATLDLPQLPDAHFTYDGGCANEAVDFFATDNTPGLQYEWSFDGGIISNLQPNPGISLSVGDHQVSLTVTNKYVCSATWGQSVMVEEVDLGGNIDISPASACEGESITLTYISGFGTTDPVHFEWYHNVPSDFPYAVTTSPTLEVTEPGQYFVFVKDVNGCWEYETLPVSVAFTPIPEPPVVSGPEVVCGDSEYELSVPENEELNYTWFLNGQPQPQWEGMHTITDSHPPGNYVYVVFAELINGGCSSAPASFTVNVASPPAIPVIDVNVVSCSPYLVDVFVTNAQPGTAYYWSNGDTGPETTMTHDGPIRVRAEVNNCSLSAQTDLPIDIGAIAWVFPKGCYDLCGEPKSNPYLLGPLGGFESWAWSVDHLPELMGSGSVADLHNLTPGGYSLTMDNGYCSLNISYMDLEAVECDHCALQIQNAQISCVQINGVPAYKISFDLSNLSGGPLSLSFNAPEGEGYFADNTFFLPLGPPQPQLLYFYPESGFNGGQIVILITGEGIDGTKCYVERTLFFPLCGLPRNDADVQMHEILLSLAPNPTKDHVQVQYQVLPGSKDNRIVLTDLFGRILMSEQLQQDKGHFLFDCNGLQAGTYLVVLQQKGNTVTSVQLIVE